MTSDEREESLRAALADLRAADRRQAPVFDSVVARSARGERDSLAGPLLRLGALATIALAAGIGYHAYTLHQRRLTVPPEVVTLLAWRPMTDALLETPGRELLRPPPPLGSSILDTGTGGNLR
jgi:hypothetical protein